MTTISDITSEHVGVVIGEYNKYIVNTMMDQQGPAAAAQLSAVLTMAGIGFIGQRAMEEFKAMFPEAADGPEGT